MKYSRENSISKQRSFKNINESSIFVKSENKKDNISSVQKNLKSKGMAIEQEVKIVGKNIADDTLQSNTDSFEENYLKELNDQFL